jgi:hypothetical protein
VDKALPPHPWATVAELRRIMNPDDAFQQSISMIQQSSMLDPKFRSEPAKCAKMTVNSRVLVSQGAPSDGIPIAFRHFRSSGRRVPVF